MHSMDSLSKNLEKFKDTFPEFVVESLNSDGALIKTIDLEKLKVELGIDDSSDSSERYQLSWPGKKASLITANMSILKTLRPDMAKSLNFSTTKNIFVEGDNLDALKLLQETYLDKVKMIFIDPPYNTGNDFVYEDDFSEDQSEYLRKSNQESSSSERLVSNTESNGRFHSDWLSMMYARLKLARSFLSKDGSIFISIDDGEHHNLRKICDEIFGEKNFVANIIWQSRTSISDDHEISMNHNHIVVYAKNKDFIKFYGNPLAAAEYENRDNDPRGPWKLVPLDANKPGGNTNYPILNPNTGVEYWPPQGRSWAINPEEYKKLFDDKRIAFGIGGDSAPKRKLYLNERIAKGDTKTPSSILLDAGTTKEGTQEIVDIFGKKKIFSYPKPTRLLKKLIQYGVGPEKNQIVMDFFGGSGTTADAVMQLNSEDQGGRRYLLVQIPEQCDSSTEAYKAGYKTISDISSERLRLSGKRIIDNSLFKDVDVGFRYLKVDSSNMSDVYYNPDAISQDLLSEQEDNVRSDRTQEDLLFQVLLDWGVDLSLPIANEAIQGKSVFYVDQNALVACFDKQGGVDEDFVKELAKRQPLRVVFRDAGFKSDSVKINVEQIFKLLSPSTEVKCI